MSQGTWGALCPVAVVTACLCLLGESLCSLSPAPFVSLCFRSLPFPLYQSADLCSHTSMWPVLAGSVTTFPFLSVHLSPLGSPKVSRHTAHQASVPLHSLFFFQVPGPWLKTPGVFPVSPLTGPHPDPVTSLNWLVTLLLAYRPALGVRFSQLVI